MVRLYIMVYIRYFQISLFAFGPFLISFMILLLELLFWFSSLIISCHFVIVKFQQLQSDVYLCQIVSYSWLTDCDHLFTRMIQMIGYSSSCFCTMIQNNIFLSLIDIKDSWLKTDVCSQRVQYAVLLKIMHYGMRSK